MTDNPLRMPGQPYRSTSLETVVNGADYVPVLSTVTGLGRVFYGQSLQGAGLGLWAGVQLSSRIRPSGASAERRAQLTEKATSLMWSGNYHVCRGYVAAVPILGNVSAGAYDLAGVCTGHESFLTDCRSSKDIHRSTRTPRASRSTPSGSVGHRGTWNSGSRPYRHRQSLGYSDSSSGSDVEQASRSDVATAFSSDACPSSSDSHYVGSSLDSASVCSDSCIELYATRAEIRAICKRAIHWCRHVDLRKLTSEQLATASNIDKALSSIERTSSRTVRSYRTFFAWLMDAPSTALTSDIPTRAELMANQLSLDLGAADESLTAEEFAVIESVLSKMPRCDLRKQIEILQEYAQREVDPKDACSITFGPLVHAVTLECGHSFSKEALTQWIGKVRTCPTCRAEIPKESSLHADPKLRSLERNYRQQLGMSLSDRSDDRTPSSTSSKEDSDYLGSSLDEEASADEFEG